MSRIQRLPALSGRFASSLGSTSLVARWVLVLAVLLAQVSAPFHHHHHDGAASPLELGVWHGVRHGGDTRASSDDHLAGSQCSIAVRSDPSRSGRLPAKLPTMDAADAAIAVNTGLQLLAALVTPVPLPWLRDQTPPDFRSHRSLPPAGRAPPFHA